MRPCLIVLIFVFGCGGSKVPAATQEPLKTPAPAPDKSAADTNEGTESQSNEASVMHERFLAVNSIRDAVVAGALTTARERAAKLANDKNLLRVFADWGPHTEDMKTELLLVAAAADLSTASVHTAAAARTCGRCHESLGIATLDENRATGPSGDTDVGSIMRRHQWAVNRMWEGLVAPSDSSWATGAKALVESARQAHDHAEAKSSDKLPVMLKEVESLATEAVQSVTSPEKTEVFGQLLTTCSGCHHEMRPDAQ